MAKDGKSLASSAVVSVGRGDNEQVVAVLALMVWLRELFRRTAGSSEESSVE